MDSVWKDTYSLISTPCGGVHQKCLNWANLMLTTRWFSALDILSEALNGFVELGSVYGATEV